MKHRADNDLMTSCGEGLTQVKRYGESVAADFEAVDCPHCLEVEEADSERD